MKHLLLALILGASVHAAELNPSHIAADANWWLHADLEAVRDTEIGKRVVDTIEDKKGAQLRAVKRMFSINPVTDLMGITLYGDGGKDRAVAIIHGSFDRAHLEDLVAAADDYSSEKRGQFTVHSWTDKKKRQHAFFAADDTLVFSHFESLLESAMETLGGKGMDPDAFVAAGSASPFLVGSANLSEVEMDDDGSELLGHAETLKIAVAESGDRMEGRMLIETTDPADGERFRKVMDGMIALGQLGNAILRDADMQFEVLTEDGGRRVNCTLSLPGSTMMEMMDKDGAFDRIGE